MAAKVPVETSYQRLILLIIAECANGSTLHATISKETVAKRACCNPSTLYRHIAWLKKNGLIYQKRLGCFSTLWELPGSRYKNLSLRSSPKRRKKRRRQTLKKRQTRIKERPFLFGQSAKIIVQTAKIIMHCAKIIGRARK